MTATAEQLAQLVTLADAHREADEYVAQQYEWDNGACAVGCTIRDAVMIGVLPNLTRPDNHKSLALALGVPEELAHLEDAIFEGLPAVAPIRMNLQIAAEVGARRRVGLARRHRRGGGRAAEKMRSQAAAAQDVVAGLFLRRLDRLVDGR